MDELKEKKILVVDDQPQLLRMVDEILRREGFTRVFLAPDCARAMEQLRAVKPDLAVLDVMLPDGDGFSLMQQMRKWFKRLRRIYSSASGWKKENRITTSFPAARRSLSHRQWA